MPLTFCHPAIILPLHKISPNRISLTGLISGSMAPDFEYFTHMQMVKTHGHDLDAMIWFTLPISIILAVLYQGLIKVPLITHAPHWFSTRLSIYNSISWFKWVKRYWYVLIYSALIGIFSHISWDSFTHSTGIFKFVLPITHTQIHIGNDTIQVFRILQHLSTLLGGIYILFFISRHQIIKSPYKPILQKVLFWSIVFFVFCFILLIRQTDNISTFIVTGISATLIGIIISSILSPFYDRFFKKQNTGF